MLTVDFGDFDDRDIKSTTTEIVNCDLLVTRGFIHAVGKCRSGRLVDDAFDFKACDLARIFGRLAL